jgi:ABC-type nitrate/sulfonate/bicarbonate transport system substrate-binding protein
MEIPNTPDFGDVPRLIAREALQRQGYVVEAAEYRDNPIAIEAMIAGKVDVASLPFPQMLAAIQKGAPIAAIVDGGVLSRTVMVAPDVRTCSDLDRKRVSVPNLVSAQALALRRYFARHCPEAEIELVVIPGLDNRVAALLSQGTAGAVLDLMGQLKIERMPGSRFNVLALLGAEFPGLSGATIVASRRFLDEHPDTAKDLVREFVVAIRQVQDPAILSREFQARIGLSAEEADAAARLALEQKMWDVNGGLSDAVVQANINFSVESGVLAPGLAPSAVVDRSYGAAVLSEIGSR